MKKEVIILANIELFGGLGEVEILALFAIIPSSKIRSTSEREKTIGLDILNLIDVDGQTIHVNFLEDRYSLINSGYSSFDKRREEELTADISDLLNEFDNLIELSEFVLDDYDRVDYVRATVEKKLGANTKDLRRYILVKFNGTLMFTDIYGLNDGTHHLKAERTRNKKGLQWENYARLLKQGVIY